MTFDTHSEPRVCLPILFCRWRHIILVLTMSFLCPPAWAQTGWGNEIQQGWQGDTLVWTRFDGTTGVNIETGRPGEPPSRWTPPFRRMFVQMQGDSCLILSPEKDLKGRPVYTFSQRAGLEFLGRIPPDLPVSRLFPVGEGYLAFAGLMDFFTLDKKASPYAYVRFGEDGLLHLENLVDYDCFGGPMVERIATPRKPAQEGNPALFRINPSIRFFLNNNSLCFTPFISVGEAGILIFHWPGYLLLLNKHGEARKVVKIYSEFDTSKLGTLLSYEPVILGTALTRDGNLLLAVREKKGVFEAIKFPVNISIGTTDAEHLKSSENTVKRHTQFTGVRWGELDPESGVITWMQQAPPGAPSTLEEVNKLGENFNFVATKNGSVRVIN